MGLACLGYQQLTSLSGATALSIPAGTRVAWLQAETQNVRYTLDGSTTPTSAVGGIILTTAPQPLELTVDIGLHDARFIEAAGSAKLNVHYFGESA